MPCHDHPACVRIVMPDGHVIHTGSSRYGD